MKQKYPPIHHHTRYLLGSMAANLSLPSIDLIPLLPQEKEIIYPERASMALPEACPRVGYLDDEEAFTWAPETLRKSRCSAPRLHKSSRVLRSKHIGEWGTAVSTSSTLGGDGSGIHNDTVPAAGAASLFLC